MQNSNQQFWYSPQQIKYLQETSKLSPYEAIKYYLSFLEISSHVYQEKLQLIIDILEV
jgi:hypothetical protein